MRSTLNLTQLMNFVSVVEWGNISKAANALNIAQPALSRQIQALEVELGTKLLKRQKLGVTPTEDGKLLLDHALRIERECLAARDSIRSNFENPVGEVHLGIPTTYSVSLGPPLIQRMREFYPGITVRIVEGFSKAIHEWILSGRLDIALLYHSKEFRIADSSPFLTEEIVALAGPDQFREKTQLTLAELTDNQAIIPQKPHFLRLAIDELFQNAGLSLSPRLEIDSLRCMVEMAHMGDGVAFLAPSCVEREIKEGRLKGLPLSPTFSLRALLVQAPNLQPSRVIDVTKSVLREVARDLAPTKGWTIDFKT